MSNNFVSFDDMRHRADSVLHAANLPDGILPLYLVRDLSGIVHLSVSNELETDETCREALQHLAGRLREVLGAHGCLPEDAVLFTAPAMLEILDRTAQKVSGFDRVYWVDRLVTGRDWWTVSDSLHTESPGRCTLFSVKGGVGRSTTAAVLAWHLSRKGERVLVVDLDLESPGLSSAMLDAHARPKFGVTDWFVEDLVGQGDRVLEQMTAAPAWAQDFEGDVRVAPAHGDKPGEYLAKLGRVYMDTCDRSWPERLEHLLQRLEESDFEPTVVLLESRSGLHDIAAATVTDLNAQVLLFAVDSESNWTDYKILFRHWQNDDLATKIRERLSIVSALTPEIDTERYLQDFRERSWDLFRDRLYDYAAPSAVPGNEFSFALNDEDAPHNPIAIHWTRGLAAGASLRDLERVTVAQAYTQFLNRFDRLIDIGKDRKAL